MSRRNCAELTLGGSAFHAAASVTGNARLPSEDRRVAGTTTSILEAEPIAGENESRTRA